MGDNELKDLSDFSMSDMDNKFDKKSDKKPDKKPDKKIEKSKPDNINKDKKRGRPSLKTPIKNKKSPTLSDLSDLDEDTNKKQKTKHDLNKKSDSKNNITKIPQSGTQPPMDISESIL